MAVRSTMTSLISRVRLLINDPAGINQQFSDQDIQDVLDESRQDIKNAPLRPLATFTGATIQWLDYYAELGNWEDDVVLKQYLITTVSPSLSENIPGHWQFSVNTLPPVYLSGKTVDLYRAAADLLERWASRWVLSYNVGVDGQSLQRSQASQMLLNLAKQYRMKQRAHVISTVRSDTAEQIGGLAGAGLGPLEIDFYSSGGGSGT